MVSAAYGSEEDTWVKKVHRTQYACEHLWAQVFYGIMCICLPRHQFKFISADIKIILYFHQWYLLPVEQGSSCFSSLVLGKAHNECKDKPLRSYSDGTC